MTTTTTQHYRTHRSRRFIVAGVLFLAVGVVANEWTVTYVLQPETPLRLAARLHWWYISLNAWAVGVWLIFWRHSITPIAVVAVSLLYVLLGLFLVAVDLAQAYVAVTRPDPRTIIGEYQVLDDRLGWTVKPNGKARVVREGVYDVSYEIGPEGVRRTIPDADAGRRIYVLGDSFAFGWGVNDPETFSSRLAEHQRGQARVVNMGVEGHGITQIYVRFNQIEPNIQAGDVVIFTVIGDDVHRNWSDFVFVSRMLFGRKPLQHFPVFENGAIRIEDTRSHANKLKALLVYAPWMGSLFGPLLLPSAGVAVKDAAQMIDKVRDAVERRGAKFMLVQLPTGGELRKNQPELDLSHLGALQLRSHFPTDPESLKPCFLSDDDGHYSPKAHRLVGDILQEELVKRGWGGSGQENTIL